VRCPAHDLGDSMQSQGLPPSLMDSEQSVGISHQNFSIHGNRSKPHQAEKAPEHQTFAEFLVQCRKNERRRVREEAKSDEGYDASDSTTSSQDEWE
jgi:hypothetical protein